jgi:hypothetical protein
VADDMFGGVKAEMDGNIRLLTEKFKLSESCVE